MKAAPTKEDLQSQLAAIESAELAALELQRQCNAHEVAINTAQDRLQRALKLQGDCEQHLENTRAELDKHREPTDAFVDSNAGQLMARPYSMENLTDVFDRIRAGEWTVSEIGSRHITPLKAALATAIENRDAFAKSNPGIQPSFD